MEMYEGYRSRTTGHGLPDVHCHDFYEVQFILTAHTVVYVNNRVFEASPRSLFIYNSRDLHRSIPDPEKEYDRYIITFSAQYARRLSTPDTRLLEWFENREPGFSHGIRLNPDEGELLSGILAKACQAAAYTGYGKDLVMQAAFLELMVQVNHLYRQAQPAAWIPHDKCLQQIRPALCYIHENLEKPLGRKELAKSCYMSVRHFGDLFREATGFTVNQYIVLQRIQLAKDLLREDLSVSGAAERAGFQDLSHFGRAFRRLVGQSPRAYAAAAAREARSLHTAEKF